MAVKMSIKTTGLAVGAQPVTERNIRALAVQGSLFRDDFPHLFQLRLQIHFNSD